METRYINEDYAQLAHDLIATEDALAPIRNSEVTIMYLSSTMEKTSARKLVYGECEKVPAKYKWAIPADFTITVFEPNVERFSNEQLKILLLHELLHIGIEVDGNEETYFVKPHDVEDFRQILEQNGMDWSK